jgi:1-acyl-sn-glycerol-3-phosphate acyltransferase
MVKRLTGALYATWALTVMMLGAALTSLPIWPFAVLPRGRRERFAIWGARFFGWWCTYVVLLSRVNAVGLENLPKKGGYLVVCNHRSWADVGLLIYLTASQGISKKEVAYLPFFGLNGWLSGAIFFDRTKRADRVRVPKEAVFLMKSGANLHIFPEGTRTRDGHLNPKVHLTVLRLAYDEGIPVLPAVVWGTEDAVPVSGFAVWPAQRMGLEVGPPLPREGHADGEAYARAVWDEVVALATKRGVA